MILDEFTYVMQANPEVPSIIQHAWDHQLKEQSAVFLILTGSLAGMIQRHVLDYQAPLYGRATGKIRLQALLYWGPGGTPAPLLARPAGGRICDHWQRAGLR